jgi:hypothetical protein
VAASSSTEAIIAYICSVGWRALRPSAGLSVPSLMILLRPASAAAVLDDTIISIRGMGSVGWRALLMSAGCVLGTAGLLRFAAAAALVEDTTTRRELRPELRLRPSVEPDSELLLLLVALRCLNDDKDAPATPPLYASIWP